MIIVTGATGKLGHAIVESLLARTDASRIGVSVRDANKAQDLAARGVRVRQATYDDPKSLRAAFEGASQVLMISSNVRASGGDSGPQHENAIAAARDAGAERVLYTAQIAASPTSAFPPAVDHATTETALRASGMPYTSLRNGFYATSAVGFVQDMVKTGTCTLPQDGKVSWTSHADLAEAAAAILTGSERFDGPTPPLTGSEALDLADLAAIASELTGKKIERVVVPDDAFRAGMAARGTPPGIVDLVLGMYVASRNGEFARVDPTLERLVGHRPIAVRDLVAEAIAR